MFLGVAWLNLRWLGRLFDPPKRRIFRIAFWTATVLTLVGFTVIRSIWRNSNETFFVPILYAASFWMILQLVLLAAWPLSALLRAWRERRQASAKPQKQEGSFPRRDFLKRAAFLPPALAVGMNASGFIEADHRLVCRYLDITDRRWPAALDGLKIAHLTDLHIGPFIPVDNLRKALSLLADSKPDLLAITGDFCDNLALLEAAEPILKDFVRTLPLGAYFCMGNHEYFRGASAFLDFMPRCGVRMLINERVSIPYKGVRFDIAGVDHPLAFSAARDVQMAKNVASVTGVGTSPEYLVLLCHHPAYAGPAAEYGVPLTLAGHTHGGQVGFMGRTLGEAFTDFSRGLYPIGDSRFYVSSGAGHWFPFRFQCPPEVSVLRLRSKAG